MKQEIQGRTAYQYDADVVKAMLHSLLFVIGDDANRKGLLETPDRIMKSWETLFSGYKMNPKDVFKIFDLEEYDEMVLIKNVEFYSTCEHHLLPFFGRAHIAYIPKDRTKVVGASKLPRLLEIYSRRLQIQERLTKQITSDLMKYLDAEGAGCVIEAQHLCMMARGIQKQNSVMVTSSLEGCFKSLAVRTEFLTLIGLK